MLIPSFIWCVIILLSVTNIIGFDILNVISVIAWGYSCVLFIKKDSRFGILSIFFLASFLTAGLINAYAENGVYMSEILEQTNINGSTTRILSLCYVLMLSAFVFFKGADKISLPIAYLPQSNQKSLNFTVNALILLFIVILVFTRIRYGNPNTYGVDRFYFWENIAPAWIGYCKFLLQHLSMFLGLMYAQKKERKYILVLIISIMSQMLVGDKFTGLYLSVIFFIVPVIILRRVNLFQNIFNYKAVMLAFSFFVILLFASYLSYQAITNGSDGYARLVNRLILQSQMWWAVDNYSKGVMLNFDFIIKHMIGIGADNNDTGIRYLMGVIAPNRIWNIFMDRGVTFTMGSPVNFIYFFGYPLSIIPVVLFGCFLGLLFKFISYSISTTNPILSIVAAKLYYVMISVYAMGDIVVLWDIKSIFCIFVILLYIALSGVVSKSKP